MSLINKMLQDLEERKSGGEALGDWQGQVRAAPAPRSRSVHWTAILAVIGLLGVAVGAGAWWMGGQHLKKTEPALPTPIVQAPPAVQTPPLTLKLDHLPPNPSPVVETEASATAGAEKGDTLQASILPAEVQKPVLEAQTVRAGDAGATPRGAEPPAASERVSVKAQDASAPILNDALRTQLSAEARPAPSAAVIPPAKPRAAPKEKARNADATEYAEAEEAGRPVKVAKQVTEFTPQQRAENEYRRALVLVDQGKGREAMSVIESALQMDGRHTAARQTLAALLIDGKRPDDAIQKLNEGLSADRAQPGLAMMQARLQVDRQDARSAIETLQLSL